MTKLSLTSRILLAYTVVFGILFSGFALLIYRSSVSAERTMLDGKLQRYAADVRAKIEEEPDEAPGKESLKTPEVQKITADDLPGAHCRLIAPDGRVLAPDTLFTLMAAHDSSFGTTTGLFMSSVGGTVYRVLRSSVEIDEREGYMLEVAAPVTEAEERLARLRIILLSSVPASLLLAALAAYLITRSALRPIVAMTETARSLSISDLDRQITVPEPRDEVRTLAETLNGMLERINRAFRSQRQFVTDASHELRTPLTVITTELEFAERCADATARESIRIALAETERLTHIADGLLLLARLDASSLPLRRDPVQLDRLVAECAHLMAGPAQKKGMTIELHVDRPAEVTGDLTRLKSVILNLLDNAIQYSGDGTTVTVSLQPGVPAKEFVSLSIDDQGYGITAEDLPRIFERFYRPAPSRANERGSGLGLAIVDRIVRLHGGTIQVSSSPGKGSTFTVRLPLRTSL
jgi:signal transduction histidine kinase